MLTDLINYLSETTDVPYFVPKHGKDPQRKKYLDGRKKHNRRTYLYFNSKRKPFSYNGVVEKRRHLDTYEGNIHGKSSRLMMREKQTWWAEL